MVESELKMALQKGRLVVFIKSFRIVSVGRAEEKKERNIDQGNKHTQNNKSILRVTAFD